MACGILVLQAGAEPGPLAVNACSPDHWTSRKFLMRVLLFYFLNYMCLFWAVVGPHHRAGFSPVAVSRGYSLQWFSFQSLGSRARGLQ